MIFTVQTLEVCSILADMFSISMGVIFLISIFKIGRFSKQIRKNTNHKYQKLIEEVKNLEEICKNCHKRK